MQQWCLVLCVVCGLAGSAYGVDVRLESYASGVDTVPIAVVPFEVSGGGMTSGDEPWAVIAGDLSFSPRFRVLRSKSADSTTLLSQGVGIYIDGECRFADGEVEIDCYLRSAADGRSLMGNKYRGSTKFLRSMAHRFSNQVVEALLGERGIFESRILYVRVEGETKDLYIMDYDGYNVKRLTKSRTVNVFPAFVDSNTIVWTSFLRGKPDIYRGSISSGKSKIFLYSRAVETSPAASPIEGLVAYASSKPGNLEIFVTDLDKTSVRRLTHRGGIDTSPCWSPNGYQIAFTSDRSGQPQIYIMDADGANTRRLTFEGSYQDSPSWSPRGDRIAYASYRKGTFDIWTIGPDGSDPKQITDKPGNNEYPSWSPDGLHLVFVRRTGGSSDLYTVRADGTGLRRLTSTGDALMPDWSPF